MSWAVRLPISDARAAGRLRLSAGVEVLVQGDEVWVRGGALDEETETALRMLPCTARYGILMDGSLLAWKERIPSGRLPDGAWTPISTWMGAAPQEASAAGTPMRRIVPKLVRGGAERDAKLLRVQAGTFAAWVETAPAARLKLLSFALSTDGHALVRGTPLPPLPGTRYADEAGIAVPCGFAFQPPVDATVLRESLALSHGDVALFAEDSTWERVPKGAFVRASRSAVRMSVALGG